MAAGEPPIRSADRRGVPALPVLLTRAVRARRIRAGLAVTGIATGVLMVLALFAAFRSPWVSVSAYLSQPGVDLWVMPSGTDNLIRTAGFLPMTVAADIAELLGVARVDPVVRVFVRTSALRPKPHASDQSLMMLGIGYRVRGGLGGPPGFVLGRAPQNDFEAAIDRAAAHRLGVHLGDTLVVNGRLARISGISRDTNLLITQFLFFDAGVAAEASGLLEQASFMLVQARGDRTGAVEAGIRQLFPGLIVLRREAFERNSLRETASGFVPVLALVAILGAVTGTVLIALLVQGVVEDRRADIAVLLALGTSLTRIGVAVVIQAVLLVLLGSAVGLALSAALAVGLDAVVPTVRLAFRPADVALALAGFVVAGILGAVMPVLRLRRIDPIEAFRS